MKRRVGAVLVREKRIVSTGYVTLQSTLTILFKDPKSGITGRPDG